MFWDTLPKNFLALAPMANVTDVSFREMFAQYGSPDVYWTEFVSADALVSAGVQSAKIDLRFFESQRPIIAQLFTSSPEKMGIASIMCRDMGFDGIDINMGCPDTGIEKSGSGAFCIKHPDKAYAVYTAACSSGLPVSVKTRIGYSKIQLDWIRFVLELKAPAVTFHLRTRNELSLVPAHWDLMADIVALRNSIHPHTLLIGNGDITTKKQAKECMEKYQCDGVMVGRGVFGNPWFFSGATPTAQEKLKALIEHAYLFEKHLPEKNFDIMKKHIKAYCNNFDGARELRVILMEKATSAEDIERIIARHSV
ncbi:MAG: tRNA-dihydrouridine synthase [Alphaproteobacteria bacterium]|nr:tRNA-dihydrouridine synthase [Alphaproteobacteria bacterium]